MRINTILSSFLVCLMWCCSITAQANAETGLYRLKSGRGTGRNLSVNASGKLMTATPNTSDLKQVWLLQVSGNSCTLRNVGNGLFVQPQGTLYASYGTDSNKGELYIQQNSSVKNGTYYNIANKNTFSGTICMHEDGSFNVVPWSASSSTASGSEWALEPASDITAEEIKACFDAVSGSTTPEPGKYYQVISPDYNRAMAEDVVNGKVNTVTPDEKDIAQIWSIEKSGSGYIIRNAYSQRLIQKQGGTVSVQYSMNKTSNGTFTISVNNNYKYETRYNMIDVNNVALHCAATQSYNVVGWYTSDGKSNTASVWYFREVTPDEDELKKAQEEYATMQDANSKESVYRSLIAKFFEDYACTTLKAEYAALSDDELREAMSDLPATLQDAAIKIKNDSWGKWEKDFRVAKYQAYSDPAYWASKLKISAYGRQNNPTGITADKNQIVYVFVNRTTPTGATLKIETCSSTSVWGSYSKSLVRGLNVVIAPEDNSQFFIMYTSKNGTDISSYDSLQIHIEGGRVNGFFDCTKRTDEDWVQMRKDGLFTGPVIDVMGQYCHWHMNKDCVVKNNPTYIKRTMDIWDWITFEELDLMGLTKNEQYPDAYEDLYPRQFNNKMECATVTGSAYMYSTSYYTGYNEYTLDQILNYDHIGSGDGTLWGPAHEIGHSNQGAIRLVGTTEVSNNLFSNMIVFKADKYTSRYWGIQEMQRWMAQKLSWPEIYCKNGERETIGTMNRMFFQLYLYYHALGNHPTFYQEIFKKLRKSPLIQPTSPNVTYAKNDYLKFAKIACEVAGEDLSEYFEYWGFFRPVNKVQIGDYSTWLITATQAEINEAKAYMKKCGPKNGNIIFIEDRVKNAYSADGSVKKTFESYSVTNCQNEFGHYTDFPLHLEASGFSYSVDSKGVVTIPAASKNAVGIKVYDKKGNLAYVAASHKFTLPEYLVKEGGYSMVAAQSDGTDIKMYNSNSDKYYTLNIYRGSNSPIIRNTDGTEESGTIPTIGANDIAVTSDADMPENITSLDNVVDAEGNTNRLNLTTDKGYYSPKDIKAKEVTLTVNYGPRFNAMVLPVDIRKTDLPEGLVLESIKATQEQDGKNYLVLDKEAESIPAATPFFIRNLAANNGSFDITRGATTLAASAGTLTTGDVTSRATFTSRYVMKGTYVMNEEGTEMVLKESTTMCSPFIVWLETTAVSKPQAYILANEDLVKVNGIEADDRKQDGISYDLMGRPAKSNQKGIIIKNGKKYSVK